MDPTQPPHEIAADLSRKGLRILAVIQNRGGEATTSEITEATNYDNSLVNYYYKILLEGKLIIKITDPYGDDEIPREGYTYRITERGTETLSAAQEDYDLAPLEEGVVRQKFDQLESRIEALEQGTGDVPTEATADGEGDRIDALEERLDELEESHRALIEDARKLYKTVEEMKDVIDIDIDQN